MQGKQKQVREALQRAQEFTTANPLPPPRDYGAPKALLDEAVARLTGQATTQVTGGRLGRAELRREEALRGTLLELHLRPIALIARASLRKQPGIDAALRLPRPQLATSQLISEAQSIRDVASQYEARFVELGRPADFLEKLDEAIAALGGAMLGKAHNFGRRAGAGQGLADTLQQGRDALKLLDAIITTAFAGNPDVLMRWRIARRIRALPGGTPVVPATGGTADENVDPKKAA